MDVVRTEVVRQTHGVIPASQVLFPVPRTARSYPQRSSWGRWSLPCCNGTAGESWSCQRPESCPGFTQSRFCCWLCLLWPLERVEITGMFSTRVWGSQSQGQCPSRAITLPSAVGNVVDSFIFVLNLLKLWNIKIRSNDFPPHVTFKFH